MMESNKKSQEGKNNKKEKAAAVSVRAKSEAKKTTTKQQKEGSQKNTNAIHNFGSDTEEEKDVIDISYTFGSDTEEEKAVEISYPSGDFQDGEQSAEECEVENGSRKSSKTNSAGKKTKGKSNEDGAADGSMFRFPMARIKRLMQCADCDSNPSQDAVFLVNKAAEKFLEKFCEESYGCMVLDSRKAIDYRQLSAVVGKRRRLDFLSDFVPVKRKANEALEERKQAAETV